MKYHILAGAMIALSVSALEATAVDYNDAYWASPAANTDFVDQFNTPNLNRSTWRVETGIFVNGEDQDYEDVEYPAADWTIRTAQPDADATDGKVLNLKARYMDGVIQNYYGGVANQGKPQFIRSGRIESQQTDATTFVYGKFEARIKMPPAKNGEFPAWWLLGYFPDVGWTACQELDIIEFTGFNATKAPQTHWSGPYAVYGGNPVDYLYAAHNINPSNEYVTYGVIKTPESADFYINGVKTYSYSRTNKGEQQPWPYLSPMHMILNHAITHVEWPDVGNYNKLSADPSVSNKTGWTTVQGGVTMYEYIDTASMHTNIGRAGTDFLVDYVAHWPLPNAEPTKKYIDESKYSFFRNTNNTKGFYSLRGWLAPAAVTGDAYLQEGGDANRDNGFKNAADGYVGSKWATPRDDNFHSIQIDYGSDKNIKYFWIEWSWNLPKAYDVYGKTSAGNWELILTSTQDTTGWATHTYDVNKTYRYIKLVTRGRIDKSESIWLLEFKAFEDVPNVYLKPATTKADRSTNIISNSSFTTGTTGWGGENYDGSGAAYAAVNGEAKITATGPGANEGSYQFHTQGFGLRKDYRYEISFKARSDAARHMVARLSEDNLNPTKVELHQDVAITTSMSTYTYQVDYTDADNAGRLSFLFGGMGSDTVYLDDVVVREVAFIGNPTNVFVKAIDPSNFVSASAGWETEWWGDVKRAIDGSPTNKGSSKPGFEGADVWLTIKIDPDYEIKQVLVAGDKSTPRSLDQFKVEYGSNFNNTAIDWTTSTLDGAYETFTNFSAMPPTGERNFKISFRPPATGLLTDRLVEVGDVQFMAIDHKPWHINAVSLDAGGSISQAGSTRFASGDSITYNFTPPAGGTVSTVIVDGVSQTPSNSYSFNNLSQSHTIAVGFSGGTGSSSSSAPSSSSSSSSSMLSSSSSSSSVASSSISSSSSSIVSSSAASSVNGGGVDSSSSSSQPSTSMSSSSVSSTSTTSSSSSVAAVKSSSSAATGTDNNGSKKKSGGGIGLEMLLGLLLLAGISMLPKRKAY